MSNVIQFRSKRRGFCPSCEAFVDYPECGCEAVTVTYYQVRTIIVDKMGWSENDAHSFWELARRPKDGGQA